MWTKIGIALAIILIVFIVLKVYRTTKPLGKAVDAQKSLSYYYTNNASKISYSDGGNWLNFGQNEVPADLATFKVLSEHYAKDKTHVFYNQYAIKSVDLQSFKLHNNTIPVDQNHVYKIRFSGDLLAGTDSADFEIIEGADPKTYESLSLYLTRDKNHIYLKDEKLPEVDAASFSLINKKFCKDAHHVYRIELSGPGQLIKEPHVKPEEIVSLSDFNFRNHNTVYTPVSVKAELGYVTQLVAIPFKDTQAIKTFEHDVAIKVENTIYYAGKPIIGADANSFEVLDTAYSKDSNHVYYNGEVVEGLDAATFSLN